MKAYLPEWKIYLWKKLLLGQSDPTRIFQPTDFIYFNKDDEQYLMLKFSQRSINRLTNSYNTAIASKQKMAIDSGVDTPSYYQYYNLDPKEAMLALIELCTEKCLEIKDIELRKNVLDEYRKKRSDYLLLEKKKHVAAISALSPHSGNFLKPDSRFTDPFCGLPKHIFKKVEKGEKLTLLELTDLLANPPVDVVICPSLFFKISIDKKNLVTHLNAYITDFMAGELIPHLGIRLFKFEQQKNNILSGIQSLANKYGKTNMVITFEEIARSGGWVDKDEHHYRFYETLFALEQSGEIEIKDLRKEEVVLSLAEKPMAEEKEKIVPPVRELSPADKKKLFILEKLKEEWDLSPKNMGGIEIKISGRRVSQWMTELDIDYFQLQSILDSLAEKNLVVNYKSINPAM